MEFVIEFDDLACSATERKVVCRRWERRESAQTLPSGTRFGKVEVELRSNRIGTTGVLSGEPA